MKVIFYGRLAESIGREMEFEVPAPFTVGQLRSKLDRDFPGLGILEGRVRACVAGAIVGDDAALLPDHPVEILAPVSGG